VKYEKKGIARILEAFCNSFAGFAATFKREEAFRQDLLLCIAGAGAYFILPPIGRVETVLYIFSFIFIIFAELANTAIETAIDRIGLERHHLSKIAKDIGSAMVLLSFANLAITISIIYAL
jgi:diacylglycerol kinase (ATP)